MPSHVAGLRFPTSRALLPRTKLAYVHLRNLLTDAKRDRSARVFGYVAIVLAEEQLLLYLQEGELVNATRFDGRARAALPITDALARVPAEPEFGEVEFNECDDEQLACMLHAHVTPPEPWPAELDAADGAALFPYLMATTFDGTLEVIAGEEVNYLILRDGVVQRAFLRSGDPSAPPTQRVEELFLRDPRGPGRLVVQRWPVAPPLPVQASPLLIQAYRDLMNGLVRRLVTEGRESAPVVAELARQTLAARHAVLKCFTTAEDRVVHDPVADTRELSEAIAAWVAELLLAVADLDGSGPEKLLRELTWERRHMFQSAGFFDRIPWHVT